MTYRPESKMVMLLDGRPSISLSCAWPDSEAQGPISSEKVRAASSGHRVTAKRTVFVCASYARNEY